MNKGNASDYTAYSNLEVQAVIKKENAFVPLSDVPAASVPPAGKTPQSNGSEAYLSKNFSDLSVEQLKAYLSAKGISFGDLRGMTKADLVARAEDLGKTV